MIPKGKTPEVSTDGSQIPPLLSSAHRKSVDDVDPSENDRSVITPRRTTTPLLESSTAVSK